MDDFNKIISESKPTLVDFYATWCGPCKMQIPIIEQLKERVGDSANILKVDIDRNSALAEDYHIQSVPTLMIFRSGRQVWRGVGVHQLDDLERKIKAFVQ
jgi:thioredoxin 1